MHPLHSFGRWIGTILFPLLAAPVAYSLPAPTVNPLPPVQTVPFVDLNRYDGLWYEVARYRNSFELGCVCTTANYTPLSATSIGVTNTCNKLSPVGPISSIDGVATVVEPETNAKLAVSFEGVPFSGAYWIIDLLEEDSQGDYTYAVVSEPSRRFVFVLSRTPRPDAEALSTLLTNLKAQYFNLSQLVWSPQPSTCEYPNL